MYSTNDKVRESNRIEDILRAPLVGEIDEFERFMRLPRIGVSDVERFVKVYQPNARLRTRTDDNVRVGDYTPPRGGPMIKRELAAILESVNRHESDSWEVHIRYEKLHPFMDGNGRSGRAIWWWMMRDSEQANNLGFLHTFYYQTLSRVDREMK